MNDFLRWLDQGRGNQSSPSRNQLSYANPKFGKRKKSHEGGQFDWQGTLLNDLPKSMGKNQTEKFNTLASQIGVPKEQLNAFKTFIDAQEYGAKTHSQHIRDYDIKKAKSDGVNAKRVLEQRERTRQQEEATRKAKEQEQAAMQQRITGFKGRQGLGAGVQGGTQKLPKSKLPESKFFQDLQKAFTGENYRIEPTKEEEERTTVRLPEGVERFGGRTMNSVTLGLLEQAERKSLKNNPSEERQRAYDIAFGEAETGGQKVADVIADILGYTAPGVGLVKGARAVGVGAKGLTKGLSKKNLKELAKEGTIVGGVMGSAEVGIREALNPEDYSALDNLLHVGINAGAGAVLDPLIGLAGPLAKHLSEQMAQGVLSKTALKQLDDAVRAGDYESISSFLKTDHGPLPQADTSVPKFSDGSVPQPTASPKQQQALALEHSRTQAPERAVVRPQEAQSRLSEDMPIEEKLTYLRDQSNPITENDIPVIHRELQTIETRINELKEPDSPKRTEMFNLLGTSDPNFRNRVSNFEETSDWMGTTLSKFDEWDEVKRLKQEFSQKNAPEQYKFHIPDSDKSTYRDVPQRFRTSDYNAPHIDNAADIAGYGTIDEFIDHLVTLNGKLTTKRADLDLPTAKEFREMEAKYKELEESIQKEIDEALGVPQMEQQLNELTNYLAPRQASASAQPRTMTAQRSAIDDLLGRGIEEPEALSDDFINQLIAQREQRTAATMTMDEPSFQQKVEENFPTNEVSEPMTAKEMDEFDPSDRTARAEVKEPLGVRLRDAFRTFRRTFDSDTVDVKLIERDLMKSDTENILGVDGIGGITEKDSLYKGVRGLQRTVAKAVHYAKTAYDPILKGLKKAKISEKEFDQYASAMHYRDIYANNMDKVKRRGEVLDGLERLEAKPDATDQEYAVLLKEMKELDPYILPKGTTEEWVEYTIKKWDNNPSMKDFHERLIRAGKENLNMQVTSGLYTPAQVEAMIKKHPNYVSMRRSIPNEESSTAVGAYRSVAKKYIQARKDGSELQTLPPLEEAFRSRILSFTQAERADVVNRIGKMLKVEGADKYFAEVPEANANTLTGYKDGKPVYYEVPDHMVNLYRSLDKQAADDVVRKSIQALASLRKKMTTSLNVGFHIYSGVRDPIQALGNSRTNAHIGHTVLGYLDSFMGEGLEKASGGAFKSYKDAYMGMGNERTTFINMDKPSIENLGKALQSGKTAEGHVVLNPFKKIAEGIESFGMKMEHGARLGEFRSGKRKGLTDADAAFEAANVIDYSDMGSLIRDLNKYVPYLNPTIRGNMRTFEALKNNPIRFTSVGLTYVTLPTVMNYAMRYSDTTNDTQREKIANLQPWQKNLTWAIPVPNTDNIVLMPKPFIFGQLFANPVERTLDKVYGHTNKSTGELVKDSVLDTLSVVGAPYDMAGVVTALEILANYDFFSQSSIENQAMQNEEDVTQRHDAYTSELAKMLGNATNLSPKKIDHAIKKSVGSLGKDALDVSDNVLSQLFEDSPAKSMETKDIMDIFKRFKPKDTQASGLREPLFNQAKADDKEWAKHRDMLKDMGIKSPTKQETNAQQMSKEWAEYDKQIREIDNDKELTSKEKVRRKKELRAKQRRLGTKFLEN